MNDRKIKFLRAVRLLAPRDTLVLQFAECVRPESLPASPGGAALELVASLQSMGRLPACPQRAMQGVKPGFSARSASRCGLNPPRRRRRF